MTIRVAIRHLTEYRFDRLVEVFPHEIRLRPAVHSRTPILGYSLRVSPQPHFLNWQQDPFGNFIARVVFPDKADHVTVDVEVLAELTVINPFDFFLDEEAERFPFQYDQGLKTDLAPYLEIRENGPRLRAWLERVPRDEMRTVDFFVEVNRRLRDDVDYRIRMEPGVQTCEETLELGIGSCRDSAWLLVQCLRHLGLAARFCSGYLVQLAADVKSLDGPSGPEADFTDLHAWCEVYVPGAGWIGLDPTSGLFAGEGHIPLACTPSPGSAAPITGSTERCEVEFQHHNEVTRVHEDPRVTKPYSESEWASIDALGRAVDAALNEADVRLTMGGEPTFLSIDDTDSAQWNTAALGAHKLKLAKDLLVRLRDRFAPGAVLHYGQGKWYPGEELPRWALGCFWRTDSQPVWRDPALLAGVDRGYGAGAAEAERFLRELARRLGLSEEYVRPAYEEPFYYVWKEQQLPLDIDPLRANLKDPLERRRLAALLERGLDTPTGFLLPLTRDAADGAWESCRWDLRREHVFLLPGDSPMGLRLPLDALLEASKGQVRPERDPFEPRTALPEPSLLAAPGATPASTPVKKPAKRPAAQRAKRASERRVAGPAGEPPPQAETDLAAPPIRETLCIEPREGRLHVFLPPVRNLEHYLTLLATVEECASALDAPVVLEGYEPPRDPRLQRLLVTPDPGVIEVNIHPAASWTELCENTLALYEEARLSRLGTEKFLLDGRHTGTGGGNHVTLGAARPEDSPFLRRPEMLGSLITFWQHHPGLSYLFSGMFIGPTSQAPRVDEGRDESLYELEIALQQIPRGEVLEPWIVDRLLRNLLVDITGNTHRAEFCIDKLYSPDTAAGRQGLVEFRAFEMPPHGRMSLTQMLLLRALVARMWKQPYRHPLVRWGTELHDRFMLPHFVWRDVEEVVTDLQRHGFPFQSQWLAPFSEFRFPVYGRVQIGDITLELRAAIEPWHVLGEEIGSFGTSRFVDSSVERLQVRVEGLTAERYVVTCNGRRLPLRPTGTHGEHVAGVRYRAWRPPSALHPGIGIHAPLVVDLVDTWNGRSIGGCTYHVSHPGGLSYDTPPVNAFAAESRRINRFWEYGHTPGRLEPRPEFDALREFFPQGSVPGPLAPPPEERNAEYPYTLDLRRFPRFVDPTA